MNEGGVVGRLASMSVATFVLYFILRMCNGKRTVRCGSLTICFPPRPSEGRHEGEGPRGL